MEKIPSTSEYQKPTVGFRSDAIDAEAIVHLLYLYIDEAYGKFIDDEMALKMLWSTAYTTGLVSESNGMGSAWELHKEIHEQGYRIGSRFSMHSKLFFRQELLSTEPTFYVEFHDNMDRPPAECIEAQNSFNTRVAEYLTERELAVPLH